MGNKMDFDAAAWAAVVLTLFGALYSIGNKVGYISKQIQAETEIRQAIIERQDQILERQAQINLSTSQDIRELHSKTDRMGNDIAWIKDKLVALKAWKLD